MSERPAKPERSAKPERPSKPERSANAEPTSGSDRAVDAMIDRAEQLHSPPEVARSLLNLTRDEDFDMRQIVDCIQRDPAMSAKMLQVVNSSRYGLRISVTNLHQAVPLLGQRTVRLIAMTFSIVETFTNGPARALYHDYWRSALATASGASRISDRLRGVDRNDVYTAGLLADVGSLVMAQAEGNQYLELYREHRGDPLVPAERARYGIDHTEVAARLLQRWEFPAATRDAIRQHHDHQITDPIALATRGGVLLDGALWQKNPGAVQICRDWLRDHFEIDTDEFTELALACREEVLLELETYGVDSDRPIDCQAIIDEARRQVIDSSLSAAIDLDSFESLVQGELSP